MKTVIKINHENEALFCNYSKERIQIGEKYAVVEELYIDEIISKPYKLENAPEENDSDDVWISPEE